MPYCFPELSSDNPGHPNKSQMDHSGCPGCCGMAPVGPLTSLLSTFLLSHPASATLGSLLFLDCIGLLLPGSLHLFFPSSVCSGLTHVGMTNSLHSRRTYSHYYNTGLP